MTDQLKIETDGEQREHDLARDGGVFEREDETAGREESSGSSMCANSPK